MWLVKLRVDWFYEKEYEAKNKLVIYRLFVVA